MENDTTLKYTTYTIPMRPGLMITLENCLGLELVMYVSMPEAVNFRVKLLKNLDSRNKVHSLMNKYLAS